MFKRILSASISLLILNAGFAQTGKTASQYYDEGIKFKDQKKYTEAVGSFKKAISLKTEYKEALYYAGWCSIELKNYDEALTYLQKAKALWPNEPKVYLEIGYALENQGKKEEAKQHYTKCISLKSDYALGYKYLGYIYYDEENYTKALDNLKLYISYEPNSTSDEVYYRKGYCENELGKYSDAIASLNKANELYPDDASTYNELGYAYRQLENADDALKNYKKAMMLNSKSVAATNGVADVYRDLKNDVTEALKYYLKTLETDPKNKKANYWTGWCYNDQERYNDAIPYLKKAIEIDNKYVSAITELGYSDYALQNYDDALIQFKRSIALEKTELNLYYSGLCYVGKKQKSEAMKYYDELTKMKSDYAGKLKKKIDAL